MTVDHLCRRTTVARRGQNRLVNHYRTRFEHYGHGLGGQVFMRKNSQDAIREFRPYFDHAPVYGYGLTLMFRWSDPCRPSGWPLAATTFEAPTRG